MENLKPEPNVLMSLREASMHKFGSTGMVSLLRNEIRKGNLSATKLANKMFVTIRDLEEMDKKCRVIQKGRTSTSGRKQKATLSETDKKKSPRDVALRKLNKLNFNSKTTLQTNSNRSAGATVVSIAGQ